MGTGIGDTNLLRRSQYPSQQAVNLGTGAATGTNKVDATGLPITRGSTPPVAGQAQAPQTPAASPAEMKPDTSKMVEVHEKFLRSQDGYVRTYETPALLEILSSFFGVENCALRLYELTWDKLARVVAKEVCGITDLNSDQADKLGKDLARANGDRQPVWLLNDQWLSMSVRDVWGSVFARGNIIPLNWTSYDEYKRFYQLGGKHNWLWSGKFPSQFSFRVSDEFKADLKDMVGQRAQAQQTQSNTPASKPADTAKKAPPVDTGKVQPLKVSIAVSSPDALEVALSATLSQGYKAESYTWIFDDGKTMRGRQITREYTKEEYRFQKDPSQKTGVHSVILYVTTVNGEKTSAERTFKVLLKKENF